MSETEKKKKNYNEDVETALIDAELFVKYKAPQRAVERLQESIAHHPRSIPLREKLREVTVTHELPEEAARQCLALAKLYIERENFESAHERLLEAKHIDPRINIASGLEAIRRARRPDLHQVVVQSVVQQSPAAPERQITLAGDLSAVNIFDAIQVIENSRLTGALSLASAQRSGRALFNEGRIVGAESGELEAQEAFRCIVEITTGSFDFEKSADEFPTTINAASNTNLILDTLRQLDEEKEEENDE